MKSMPMWPAILILLAGCASDGPAIDSFCLVASPILVSRADQLTAETARQILAHNEFGASRCGWKAVK